MKPDRLLPALSLLTLARLIVNTGHRLVSPFLPVIARGLGVPLESAGVLIAARSAATMATPAIVTMGRRYDRRALIQVGLVMFAIGSGIAALVGVYAGVMVGFVLMGLGKALFDVSGQAYLSDRTPYEQRARWLGFFEATWAGGFLIGAPAVGWVIANRGWEDAYLILAVLVVVITVASVWMVQADHPEMGDRGRLILSRSAAALLVVVAALSGGSEMVTLVLGAWLEDTFLVALAAIAGLASLIGVAEITGAFSTAAFTDRLGKKRAVLLGLVINGIGYATMAMAGDVLAIGIVGSLIAFAGFEFTIISSFPLASELAPGGRARYLAWLVVAIGLGRVIAGLAAPRVFTTMGFSANATIGIICNLVAIFVLWTLITEPEGGAVMAPLDSSGPQVR